MSRKVMLHLSCDAPAAATSGDVRGYIEAALKFYGQENFKGTPMIVGLRVTDIRIINPQNSRETFMRKKALDKKKTKQ